MNGALKRSHSSAQHWLMLCLSVWDLDSEERTRRGGEPSAGEGEHSWFQSALCFNDRCSAPQWPGLNATSQRTLRSPLSLENECVCACVCARVCVCVRVSVFYAVLLRSATVVLLQLPSLISCSICSNWRLLFPPTDSEQLSLKLKSLCNDGSTLPILDFSLRTISHEKFCLVFP